MLFHIFWLLCRTVGGGDRMLHLRTVAAWWKTLPTTYVAHLRDDVALTEREYCLECLVRFSTLISLPVYLLHLHAQWLPKTVLQNQMFRWQQSPKCSMMPPSGHHFLWFPALASKKTNKTSKHIMYFGCKVLWSWEHLLLDVLSTFVSIWHHRGWSDSLGSAHPRD